MRIIIERLRKKIIRNASASRRVVVNPACQELEVDNWLISEFIINKLVPIVGVHPYPINEQCLMVAAVCALKPSHIFEWGTNLGKSARIFHEIARRFDIITHIYSVDLPDDVEHAEHPKKNRGIYVKNIKEVELALGDGLEMSLNKYKQFRKQNDLSPLFFIDGDHDYGSVKRELEGIINTVPKANILLHDTFFQSPESHYNVGPYRAVQDVMATTKSYKVLRQELGLPGMTLLYQ